MITLCSAVDRFISITFPLKYFKLDTKYSTWLISSPILLMLPIFILATIQTYDARDRVVRNQFSEVEKKRFGIRRK